MAADKKVCASESTCPQVDGVTPFSPQKMKLGSETLSCPQIISIGVDVDASNPQDGWDQK